MIVIIDYGVGNLSSIKNMMKKAGCEAVISSDPEIISSAEKLILPGVGSFDHGISSLKSASFFNVLEEKVMIKRTPVLGVCLGAQLMAESSEEGNLPGLNWIEGNVIRFKKEQVEKLSLKIPHMGWAEIYIQKNSNLFRDMYPDSRFYFVHSYHWVCSNANDVLVSANYGYDFTAGIEHGNIAGVQFHPEKSHKYGLRLFENFIKYF
jgi:glutamine amidotransferase